MATSGEGATVNMEKLDPLDSRMLEWDFTSFTKRNCPICGNFNEKTSYLRPDNCHVKTCSKCGCLYVSPSPSESQLAEFYQKYHEEHFGSSIRRNVRKLSLEYEKNYPVDDPRVIFLKKDMKISQSSDYRVLDFGCGTGSFLYQAKLSGAKVNGIELDESAVNLCHAVGLDSVETGGVDLLDSIKDRFDLIVLNDVIEHPLNPGALMSKLTSLLTETGKIMIWTPNGDAINTDEGRVALRVDLEHMQYLTIGAVKELCFQNNLQIFHYSQQGFPSESNFLGSKRPNDWVTSIKLVLVTIIKFLRLETRIRNLFRMFLSRKFKNSNFYGNYHLFIVFSRLE